MSETPSLLEEYVNAMQRCRTLYLEGADCSRNRKSLEALHAGLLIKIYTAFALADQRWQLAERPLAAALVRHLWNTSLEGDDLKRAVVRLTAESAKVSWYSVLRPFSERNALRELAGELEIVALQLAKLVAAADGPIQPAELEMLRTLRQELETHLKPISVRSGAAEKEPDQTLSDGDAGPTPIHSFSTESRTSRAQGDKVETTGREANVDAKVDELVQRLHALTGLTQIKAEVESLANFIRFQQKRAEQGLPTSPLNLHMVFTGNPGTGKTTVARLLGEILQAMGILARGHMVETDRSGLIAEYAGQTAPKTNRLIDSALDGILFIDEAYGLLTRPDDAYGHEAIQTLVKRMEDDRHRLVVILAGYAAPMQNLLRSNPGLGSRFSRYLHFADYSPEELLEIFVHFCYRNHFHIPAPVRARLYCGLSYLHQQRDEHFGNGRLVRNIFEDAIRRLANRISREPEVSHAALTDFAVSDIAFQSIPEAELANRLEALRVISPCSGCGKRVRQRAVTVGMTMACPHCQQRQCFEWGEVAWVGDRAP